MYNPNNPIDIVARQLYLAIDCYNRGAKKMCKETLVCAQKSSTMIKDDFVYERAQQLIWFFVDHFNMEVYV